MLHTLQFLQQTHQIYRLTGSFNREFLTKRYENIDGQTLVSYGLSAAANITPTQGSSIHGYIALTTVES